MSNQDQQQLGKTLWAIADDLRGAMNVDDFRENYPTLPEGDNCGLKQNLFPQTTDA